MPVDAYEEEEPGEEGEYWDLNGSNEEEEDEEELLEPWSEFLLSTGADLASNVALYMVFPSLSVIRSRWMVSSRRIPGGAYSFTNLRSTYTSTAATPDGFGPFHPTHALLSEGLWAVSHMLLGTTFAHLFGADEEDRQFHEQQQRHTGGDAAASSSHSHSPSEPFIMKRNAASLLCTSFFSNLLFLPLHRAAIRLSAQPQLSSNSSSHANYKYSGMGECLRDMWKEKGGFPRFFTDQLWEDVLRDCSVFFTASFVSWLEPSRLVDSLQARFFPSTTTSAFLSMLENEAEEEEEDEEARGNSLLARRNKALMTDMLVQSLKVVVDTSCAYVACQAVSFPFQLIFARMAMQGSGLEDAVYRNGFHCAVSIFREEGFSGFYKGLLPETVRVLPLEIAFNLAQVYLLTAVFGFPGPDYDEGPAFFSDEDEEGMELLISGGEHVAERSIWHLVGQVFSAPLSFFSASSSSTVV
ncbi:mitochondrial FAD carrier protein flx1 [Balamuthia mandrillaris]